MSNVPKVYEAIAEVMGELAKVGIGKTNKNAQQGYRFRGIDDVLNALAPMLWRAKLIMLPRVLTRSVTERETKSGGALFYVVLDVEYDFVSAIDGSEKTVRVVGEAMDSADKATNKAMSAAYKYAAIQAFCIPTEGDNDADATTHEPTARPGVTVVDPRGESRPPQDQTVVNEYVTRFREAMDNPDDEEAALATFKIHGELAGKQDLYMAIGDALGSKYKNALHKFVQMAKRKAA